MLRRLKSVFSQYMGQSRSIYVLFFGRMITNMGAFIWPMLVMILTQKMGYSIVESGFVVVLIGFIFLPATWIGGKLADRFSRKRLIIILDIISVSFFIACAFIVPGRLMLVFFVLAGWFANVEAPIFESLIVDVTKPSEREVAFSLTYLGKNLGMVIGTAVGGLLFKDFLNLAFALDGITTLISTIMIVAFVVVINKEELVDEEINEYEEEIDIKEKTAKVLFDRRSVLIQLLIFFLVGFIYEQYVFTLPAYMNFLFGADGARMYGLVASFNAFTVIVLTPIITKMSEPHPELAKIIIGVLLFASSFMLISNKPIYLMFFVFMFMFTIGEILNMLGTSPFVSRRVPKTHLGRVNSYVYIVFFLGTMSGKIVMSLVVERYDYSTAFVVLAVLGVLTATISWLNMKVDRERFPKIYERKLEVLPEID